MSTVFRPSSPLKIVTDTSGQSTPNSNADELVVENSSDAGISILTPDGNTGRVSFGDASNNNIGGLEYQHSSDSLVILANANQALSITNPASAVNYLEVSGSATGNNVLVSAAGADADVNVDISPKGTGNLILNGLNWPTSDGTNGQVLQTDGSGNLTFASVSASDEQVKISSNDTTADYLENKLIGGTNISLSVNNDGSNETLTINASGSGTSEDLVGSSNSTTIVDGIEVVSAVNHTAITNAATGNNPEISAAGSDASINLLISPKGTGNLVLDGLSWPTADGNAGDVIKTDGSGNLSFTSTTGTDEKVGISSNDTTPGYLEGKLVAGTNITLTINNDGGDETLTIDASDSGITAVVDDTTPQLGGNLDVQSNEINTSITDGNITITPNGAGNIVLDSLNWPISDGTSGQVLTTDGSGNLSFTTVSVDDEQVKVSSNDTTTGYLEDKLVGGNNVTLTTNNDGSNETITIDATDTGITAVVEDTTPQLGGNLDVQSNEINTSVADGSITISSNGTGNIVLDGLNWPTSDGINGQALVTDGAGNLTFANVSSSDESVKVSSNDTTAGYLEDKLIAGSNVTFTTNNDGSNETLTINASSSGTSEDLVGSSNSTTIVDGIEVASAVNYTSITNASTGSNPEISVAGGDTNIDLLLSPKGTGNLVLDGLSWPTADGNAGDVIKTDGAGNLSFTSTTGTDEKVGVSSNDTTPGYLNGKLVAGTNITLTENNDAGDETLTINASSGSGSVNWLTKSTNYTASSGEKILADTSSTSWTLTLPNTPTTGNFVIAADYNGNWGTNSLIIDGNGNTIEGSSTFDANLENGFIELVFEGTEWKTTIHGGNTSSVSDSLIGSSGNTILDGIDISSAVNYGTFTNAITGNNPELSVDGSDTNINLVLSPKGTGNLVLDGLNWPTSDGTNGQVIQTDGAGNLSFTDVATATGLAGWTVQSSAYTASTGDKVLADTSSSAWTLTLPASPSTGDAVMTADSAGNWNNNNLTIDGNSNTIEGSTTFVANIQNGLVELAYNGTEWKVAISTSSTSGTVATYNTYTVQTTDATVTTIASIPISAGNVRTIRMKGYGIDQTSNDVFASDIWAAFKNIGGTTTMVGNEVADIANNTGASSWDIVLIANDASDTIDINVTGEAGKTIDWEVKVEGY